jgi:hypothetical protein
VISIAAGDHTVADQDPRGVHERAALVEHLRHQHLPGCLPGVDEIHLASGERESHHRRTFPLGCQESEGITNGIM